MGHPARRVAVSTCSAEQCKQLFLEARHSSYHLSGQHASVTIQMQVLAVGACSLFENTLIAPHRAPSKRDPCHQRVFESVSAPQSSVMITVLTVT